MRLYTFATESHLPLLRRHFLRTFPYGDMDLNIRVFPQECRTGDFVSEGWNLTMRRKVRYVVDMLNETPADSISIHADCDIVFNGGFSDRLTKLMEGRDLMFAHDGRRVACMGFVAARPTPQVKEFFTRVLQVMPQHKHDQDAANHLLKDAKIRWGFLPDAEFWTHGLTNKIWKPGMPLPIPQTWKVFHGNWCVGVSTKQQILKLATG